MHGYVVSRPVVLRSATQVKHISACEDLQEVGIDRVQIDCLGELAMLREALARQYPDAPLESLMRIVPYEKLADWSRFPMRLGRRGVDVADSADVLRGQLRALKARHPQRQRFRILINNGFGTNLGDTVIGLTAWRAAWSLLKEELAQVSIDVLSGWMPLDGVTHLLRQHEGVEQFLRQGPTLQALARYQGLFDFSDLLRLPGYGTMPTVDWYLWWLGLDPAQVAPAEKRNRIALEPADAKAVAERLRACDGPTVLINAKASEPLRSMPQAVLQSLARAVLEAHPARWVVFDQPVAFEHPRALHLDKTIDSPQRLAALVAQVDALITPDTFAQHIADATATPTCTLSATAPAECYRYYPTVKTLVLPGAESLGGWGRSKVSPSQWEDMAPAYAQAWSRLEPAAVRHALDQAARARRALMATTPLRIDRPRPPFRPTLVAARASAGLQPCGQRPDAGVEALSRLVLHIGAPRLLSGDTVALLGAGAGALALPLAERIAPTGRLIAFEPRRMIHQVLCANLVRAGHEHVETHGVMPTGGDFSVAPMPALSLREDHIATAAANQSDSEPVVCWPLDRLALTQCRMIVLQAPVPVVGALQGARETLRRHRPLVVAGPIRADELAACHSALGRDVYDVRTYRLSALDGGQSPLQDDAWVVLAAQPRTPGASGEQP